ncbi:hypothetical protein [Thermoactinomyces sp. DSM 45892]|uniref:hypothetical protein n=1 Tax=Thermoactinomyces sp. DSM 45892 TaxID=1882753 RepID=UPI00089A7671|nr:hypothetical protein [Thermoactinomyces sp. DSM 45892]SDZ06119.1 hypothetical protein SAMN05444416_112122 [Thermoactinomyces sp. DSM 45892]
MDKNLIKFEEEVPKLGKQFYKVLDAWYDLDEKDFDKVSNLYPFHKDFQELPLDVSIWHEFIEEYLKSTK